MRLPFTASRSKAARCPFAVECPIMQARRPSSGFIAQNAGSEVSAEAPHPVPGIRHQNKGITH